MKNVGCGAVIAASLALGGGQADAADLGRPAPAPSVETYYGPAGYNWGGLYVGGFVGMAHGLWTVDFYRNNNHGHAEEASNGFAGGLWVGYNWQTGPHLVLGVEADLGWSNASQNNQVFDNDHTDSSLGMFGSLRGRVGYAMDRVMLFATAGLAFADISQNIQKGRNAGEQVVWEDQRPVGWVIGAGIDYAFDQHWVGRAEFLHADYGSVSLVNRDGNQAIFANDMNLLRVGLSYRF